MCEFCALDSKVFMNARIKKLLRFLIVEFCSLWLIAIILFVLGETNVIPNGLLVTENYSNTEYCMNVVNVLLVIVCVPLALKLFALNTRFGLRRMNQDEALNSYHTWSLLRLAILLLCIAYGIVAYFLLMDSTGLLCACIAMVASFFCLPSEDKIMNYLEMRDEEQPETDIPSNDSLNS